MNRALVAVLVAACGSSQAGSHEDSPVTHVPAATDAAPPRSEEDREAEQVAAIEYAVNQTGEAVHACYKRATAAEFQMEGVVVLGIAFADDGSSKVEIASDEPNSPLLARCLVDVFTAFQWPAGVFDAGQGIQLPLSFVAATAQYTVHRADARVHEVGAGIKATVILDLDSTGNAAAALSVLELDRGVSVPLHTHTSAELLYVTKGKGTVFGVKGASAGAEVGAGSAIYIAAGVAHGFVAGADGVEAVQLYAPGGPEQRFEGDTQRTDTAPVTEKQANKLARKRNTPAPLVATVDGTEKHELGKAMGSVAILFDKGSAKDGAAYVGLLSAESGFQVPPHRHADETELLYVLQGGGTMTVAGQQLPVRRGTAVQIPPDVEHSFIVESKAPVLAVQFYTPSGPEQRFKKAK